MSEGDFVDSEFDEFDPQEVAKYQQQLADEGDQEEDAALKYIRRRKIAYANVFSAGERTQADIDIVMADLMWFCRATRPTYDKKDGPHAEVLSRIKEGRREAFYRIKEFSALGFDTLLFMYTDAITKQEN